MQRVVSHNAASHKIDQKLKNAKNQTNIKLNPLCLYYILTTYVSIWLKRYASKCLCISNKEEHCKKDNILISEDLK